MMHSYETSYTDLLTDVIAVDRTASMPQYHLAELARKGWYANPVEAPGSHLINSWHTSPGGAGTQTRPKPRMSAKIRYGTA